MPHTFYLLESFEQENFVKSLAIHQIYQKSSINLDIHVDKNICFLCMYTNKIFWMFSYDVSSVKNY